MRTSDQTLINRIIADADRKDHLHDMACQFVARTDAVEKLRWLVFKTALRMEVENNNDLYRGHHTFERVVAKHELEMPITGRNKFLIGYADVVLRFGSTYSFNGEMRISDGWQGGNIKYKWEPCPPDHDDIWRQTDGIKDRIDMMRNQCVLVEVKVHVPPIGELLRQIKLYQSHITDGHAEVKTVVVTCAPIDANYKRELDAEGIKHAYLSPERVRAWHKLAANQIDSLEL